MSSIAPLNLLSATLVLDTSLIGWTLLEPAGEGTRDLRYEVVFSRAFSAPPVIQVGIVGLDVSKEDNLRVRVRALDISHTGFTLLAQTWLGTRVWSVEVSWLAIGS